MGEYDLGSGVASDLTGTVTDYSVQPVTTDAATDQKETTWVNQKWTQQLGYYKNTLKLKSVINAKARWTIGKGFKSNEITEILLMSIKGIGKDTFNTIMENMVRTYHISGDSFAEIIRDKEGILINLKPLSPGDVQIVANRKGLIIRYELLNKVSKKTYKTLKPNQMFHLCRNRVADEIHGESLIPEVEKVILAIEESMADTKQLMHWHVKPRIVYKLDTDDTTKIASFKAMADAANDKGENIYIPKDAVDFEILTVPPNSTLNPLPYQNQLNGDFYQAAEVPQIIVGGSGEFIEGTAKILYLCFQQTISEEQLYCEEQVLSQLNLEIEYEMPASIQNDMLSDNKKDGPVNIDPSETTADMGGDV